MLALKDCGDVFSLYRSRDQRPVVKEEKEELIVGSEGLWRCVVPVQRPMCSVCTGPETDVFSLYQSRDQRPMVEKRELSVGSEGVWRCVQFVPVLRPATGGARKERRTQCWL